MEIRTIKKALKENLIKKYIIEKLVIKTKTCNNFLFHKEKAK